MKRTRREPMTVHLGGVLEFMSLLWALNHELESLSKRMNAEFGVTGPQRLVLRIIGQLPNISAGELAAILHMHPSTLTGIVRRLGERELLARTPDPGDARRALFTLTPRGRAIDELRRGTVEAAVEKVLRRANPAKRRAAEAFLKTLIDGLEGRRRRSLIV